MYRRDRLPSDELRDAEEIVLEIREPAREAASAADAIFTADLRGRI